MNFAMKLGLLASGVFLLTGLFGGVLKYRAMMRSPDFQAPVYIDIAHRASLLYSFAALVMAELLRYSPYSDQVQLWSVCVPLMLFALTITQYFFLGIQNKVSNQFQDYSSKGINTAWPMTIVIIGEIGGVGVIVWGFVSTQILR